MKWQSNFTLSLAPGLPPQEAECLRVRLQQRNKEFSRLRSHNTQSFFHDHTVDRKIPRLLDLENQLQNLSINGNQSNYDGRRAHERVITKRKRKSLIDLLFSIYKKGLQIENQDDKLAMLLETATERSALRGLDIQQAIEILRGVIQNPQDNQTLIQTVDAFSMILEEESSHFQRIQSLNWRGILLYLLCVGIRGAIHAALTFMQILSHLRFQIMEEFLYTGVIEKATAIVDSRNIDYELVELLCSIFSALSLWNARYTSCLLGMPSVIALLRYIFTKNESNSILKLDSQAFQFIRLLLKMNRRIVTGMLYEFKILECLSRQVILNEDYSSELNQLIKGEIIEGLEGVGLEEYIIELGLKNSQAVEIEFKKTEGGGEETSDQELINL